MAQGKVTEHLGQRTVVALCALGQLLIEREVAFSTAHHQLRHEGAPASLALCTDVEIVVAHQSVYIKLVAAQVYHRSRSEGDGRGLTEAGIHVPVVFDGRDELRLATHHTHIVLHRGRPSLTGTGAEAEAVYALAQSLHADVEGHRSGIVARGHSHLSSLTVARVFVPEVFHHIGRYILGLQYIVPQRGRAVFASSGRGDGAQA